MIHAGADEAPVVVEAPVPAGCRDVAVDDPRGTDGVVHCWELRGCAGIFGFSDFMESECPHNVPDRYSPCPATCAFTRCQRPWHREATSLDDLLDPRVDRMQTMKEQCRHCLHFIAHGPRVKASGAPAVDSRAAAAAAGRPPAASHGLGAAAVDASAATGSPTSVSKEVYPC